MPTQELVDRIRAAVADERPDPNALRRLDDEAQDEIRRRMNDRRILRRLARAPTTAGYDVGALRECIRAKDAAIGRITIARRLLAGKLAAEGAS